MFEMNDGFGGGGSQMGLLASFNSGIPAVYNTQPTTSSVSPWGALIGGGLSILNNWLMTRNQGQGFQTQPTLTPAMQGGAGASLAAIGAAVVAAGGRLIGNVVRISRAGYASLPAWVKEGIVALGLSLLISDAADGSGGLIRYGGATGRRRRAKGITGAELRGFNKMSRLLKKVGMRPKALGGGSRRRCK